MLERGYIFISCEGWPAGREEKLTSWKAGQVNRPETGYLLTSWRAWFVDRLGAYM
jgi:hypothetical protein